MRLFFCLASLFVLCGCASSIPLTQQHSAPEYSAPGFVGVSVVDQRKRVKGGKDPNFIGVVHGAFGIPYDWHVDPVLAVEPGDDERNLAEFLEFRMISGLSAKEWQAKGAGLSIKPSDDEVLQLMSANNLDYVLLLQIREWYFSINLNWVSAFNFDTDTLVYVYKSGKGLVLKKEISGRDVVDEEASQSLQNHILLAYKAQLDEIINDSDIREAIMN